MGLLFEIYRTMREQEDELNGVNDRREEPGQEREPILLQQLLGQSAAHGKPADSLLRREDARR